jgi:predicted aldo/keto reductase-like oxidoreductase
MMQYRSDRNGQPLSILGYGCMRFTKKGNSIDVDKADRDLRPRTYKAGIGIARTFLFRGTGK